MAPQDPVVRRLVNEMNRSLLADRFRNSSVSPLTAEGEMFPSAVLPVTALNKAGELRVFPMKWGFPRKGGLLINARCETAPQKPTFCESWQKHRCIITVSWYFEWDHSQGKGSIQKYALRPEGATSVRLAGLYRMENDLPVFVILTRPADEKLLWMHSRMPLMLSASDAEQWIRLGSDPESLIRKSLTRIVWDLAV